MLQDNIIVGQDSIISAQCNFDFFLNAILARSGQIIFLRRRGLRTILQVERGRNFIFSSFST